MGVSQAFVQFGSMSHQGLDMAPRAMVSRAVGPTINFYALSKCTSSLKLTLRGYRPDWEIIPCMLALGALSTIAGME